MNEGKKLTGPTALLGKTRQSTKTLQQIVLSSEVDEDSPPALISWSDVNLASTSVNDKLSIEERQLSFDKELEVWKTRQAYRRI